MNTYVSLMVECPSPVGPMPVAATRCFTNAFSEQVVLRMIPLLASALHQNTPMALVLSPATIEALAREDWISIIDDAEKKCASTSTLVSERITNSRKSLAKHDGSLIEFLKSAVKQSCLRLITRPFEGMDFSCWISHPGLLNFHFQAAQTIYEYYFDEKSTEISLIGCGYAPHLDAALNDAGFTIVYVDAKAVSGAQSKLHFGVHRPILNPANGIALCPVDTALLATVRHTVSIARSHWLNTGVGAILRDEVSGLSDECYADEDGRISSYDGDLAGDALDDAVNSATHALKRRLSGKAFKAAHSLTTIWCPNNETLWWEEANLGDSFTRLADGNGWHLAHAKSYLETYPEQDTAWLGSVLSAHADETAHPWLPRHVVTVFERFRAAELSLENDSHRARFETIARLLLFSKVNLRTYFGGSALDFLSNQTAASLLKTAEELLDQGHGSTPHGGSLDSTHPIFHWARDVSLVSVTRA